MAHDLNYGQAADWTSHLAARVLACKHVRVILSLSSNMSTKHANIIVIWGYPWHLTTLPRHRTLPALTYTPMPIAGCSRRLSVRHYYMRSVSLFPATKTMRRISCLVCQTHYSGFSVLPSATSPLPASPPPPPSTSSAISSLTLPCAPLMMESTSCGTMATPALSSALARLPRVSSPSVPSTSSASLRLSSLPRTASLSLASAAPLSATGNMSVWSSMKRRVNSSASRSRNTRLWMTISAPMKRSGGR